MADQCDSLAVRRAELARIHILKAELGLDRDTYEAVLWTVARVNSSADLDGYGRRRLIEHFKSKLSGIKARPMPADAKEALLAKIAAQLSALGKTEAYAAGMAWKMFQVEQLNWCTPDQLRRIVAALTYAQRRAKAPAHAA